MSRHESPEPQSTAPSATTMPPTDRPVADREPLSPEEEAALRRDLSDGATYWIGPIRTARLLATLDAARAHPDEAVLRRLAAEVVAAYTARPDTDENDHPEGLSKAQVEEAWARWDIRQLNALDALRAALTEPAVPVAGAKRIDWSNVVVDEGDEAP